MSKLRVLIADDDPIIRLDLRNVLESLGYEVVGEAGDGQQAVEMAREKEPDVCLLDVKMPIMDGIEAVEIIMNEGIAPAILLTAYSDGELVAPREGRRRIRLSRQAVQAERPTSEHRGGQGALRGEQAAD